MSIVFARMVCSTHLKDEQKQEVGISNPLKLLKKVEGQKGKPAVLGGLDGIGLITNRKGEPGIYNTY